MTGKRRKRMPKHQEAREVQNPGQKNGQRDESRGHVTGLGKTDQQRAEGEVLTRVPGAHPMPEEEYLRKAAGIHQP